MNSQLALLTAYSRAACKPTPPSALVYVRISSATLVIRSRDAAPAPHHAAAAACVSPPRRRHQQLGHRPYATHPWQPRVRLPPQRSWSQQQTPAEALGCRCSEQTWESPASPPLQCRSLQPQLQPCGGATCLRQRQRRDSSTCICMRWRPRPNIRAGSCRCLLWRQDGWLAGKARGVCGP